MAIQSELLAKVTLNLYASDVEDLNVRYGYGWSTVVRRLVHEHLIRSSTTQSRPLTVGDLDAHQRD